MKPIIRMAGFLFLFATAGSIPAQDISVLKEDGKSVELGTRYVLRSHITNEDRIIVVHTPTGYGQSDALYPVLYVMDAEWHLHHAIGTAEYLALHRRIPPMIVVCLFHPDRFQDTSPNVIPDEPGSGGAENFLRFLREECFPFVESQYRTYPCRVVMGHSLCGMLAIYTLITHPDMFFGTITPSPFLGYDNGYLIRYADEHITKGMSLDKILYMTMGDEYGYKERIRTFTDILKSKKIEGLEWTFTQHKEESHETVVPITLYDGLQAVFADWRFPEKFTDRSLEEIRSHYQDVSERYGFPVPIPESALNRAGYRALERKDFEKAITLFEHNVTLYADSPNVYDSLGEAYEKKGDIETALTFYDRAYKMARDQRHYNTFNFYENFYRVKKRLEQMR